jgi:uncharacterized protein YjiS (DUF1127 family)
MNARAVRAGPIVRSDAGVTPAPGATSNGLLSALRALWRALRRAVIFGRGRRAREVAGGLAELDDRLLKDLGYLRSDVVGMAARRVSGGETVRYRNQL